MCGGIVSVGCENENTKKNSNQSNRMYSVKLFANFTHATKFMQKEIQTLNALSSQRISGSAKQRKQIF